MYYFNVIAKKLMFNDNKGRGKELYTVIFSDSKDRCIALLKCEISQNSQDLKLFVTLTTQQAKVTKWIDSMILSYDSLFSVN